MEFKEWGATIGSSFAQLWQMIIAYLPKIVVATAVVLVGWLVAHLLRAITARLVARLSRLAPGRRVGSELKESGVERLAGKVVSRVVFWLVLLLFVAVAGEVLGLQAVTEGLGQLVAYLPSILAALLVVLAGIVLGNLARAAVRRAASSAGVAYGEFLGQTARTAILLVAGVVALDQIGVESTFLIITLGILLGTVVGGAALAFGLGAREAVGGFIAAHYVAQSYQVGNRVRVGDVHGQIVELTRTAVVLDTPEGRALVPAVEFGRTTSFLLPERR